MGWKGKIARRYHRIHTNASNPEDRFRIVAFSAFKTVVSSRNPPVKVQVRGGGQLPTNVGGPLDASSRTSVKASQVFEYAHELRKSTCNTNR